MKTYTSRYAGLTSRNSIRAAKLLKLGEHLTIPDAPGLQLEASSTRRA
ncbi:hypothetical protein [Caldimonas tepidiphila]|nr:hypothetical protein [Caldimonas tepidiphila]